MLLFVLNVSFYIFIKIYLLLIDFIKGFFGDYNFFMSLSKRRILFDYKLKYFLVNLKFKKILKEKIIMNILI